MAFLTNKAQLYTPVSFVTSLNAVELKAVQEQIVQDELKENLIEKNVHTEAYLNRLNNAQYQDFVDRANVDKEKKYEYGWSLFKHKIPMWIFFMMCCAITYFCIKKNLSLIPVLGLMSCLYMMCELGISNWIGFGIWLIIGLVVYFCYGYKHSKLNKDVG